MSELTEFLTAHPKWTEDNGFLCRTFEFADFVEAFGFMSRVALIAEKMEHHPDWSNVYKTVKIALRTHDIDAIGPKDFALAAAIDSLV